MAVQEIRLDSLLKLKKRRRIAGFFMGTAGQVKIDLQLNILPKEVIFRFSPDGAQQVQ